jgi:protein tyrosine/serine phosphatase
VGLQNFFVQFAFLYAPLLHCHSEQVTPNLMRGPDPKMADIQSLHDKGIKTIISCRTNPQPKKRAECEKLGMKWIQITTGVFKVPSDEQFDQFRAIVNDPKNQPLYTSCEIDMDRTGVYIAAYRMVDQHWTAEQMDQEFHSHHQKRWWPIFRKYQAHVIAYAQKKQQEQNTANISSNKPAGPVSESITTQVQNVQKKEGSAPELSISESR